MEKNISILNHLHKYNISIAANPSLETANPDAPAQSNVPPVPPPPPPQQPVVSKQLSEAIQRRVNDIRLSRHDLAVRIAESLAGIDREIAESERRLQELRPRREHLMSIADDLNKESPINDDGAATQSQIAAVSRRLDDLRLDACRMIAESTATTQNIPLPAQTAPSYEGIDWNSVTFGQLCRIGWGLFFPFIVSVIVAAFLIGAAVIAAFNGTIKW